jgi:hypothetical protein
VGPELASSIQTKVGPLLPGSLTILPSRSSVEQLCMVTNTIAAAADASSSRVARAHQQMTVA